MVKIFGREYRKEDLKKFIGQMEQIAGTKFYSLEEGKGRGVRGIDVWTGSGFRFTILPERGMDISEASFCGMSLCWRSSTGDIHPHFYEPENFGWLRGFFGGLLTTCGLITIGQPSIDEGKNLGLHGRFSYLPAEKVRIKEEWKEEEYLIEVEGEVRESAVFGENILLQRKITTRMGERKLWIEDKVVNEGFEETPHMVLYHINIGFPVVAKGARLLTPSEEVIPRDEEAEKGKEEWGIFSLPIKGYKEKCYYHRMREDSQGLVHCALINEKIDLGVYVIYPKKELPWFVEWKMMGEGIYVVGMEPGNALVEGRAREREEGRLKFLKPGEEKKYWLEIGVLCGRGELKEFEEKIKK